MSPEAKKKERTIKRTNKHHRKSRSRGGDGSPRNVVEVPIKQHDAFHLLFQNTHPDIIAKELNEKSIDPDFQIVAIPRKKQKGKHLKSFLVLEIPHGFTIPD